MINRQVCWTKGWFLSQAGQNGTVQYFISLLRMASYRPREKVSQRWSDTVSAPPLLTSPHHVSFVSPHIITKDEYCIIFCMRNHIHITFIRVCYSFLLVTILFFVFFIILRQGLLKVAQAGLELVTLLPQPPESEIIGPLL